MNRRRWLQMACAGLVGAVGGTLLGELFFRGGAPPPDIDAELEALRRAAETPGPARAKLARLSQHRPIEPLPFDVEHPPLLSPATHRLHHEHHYLEYLWRWEQGDRDFASDGGDFAARREGDQAAAMVAMHLAYWRDLVALRPEPSGRREAEQLATALLAEPHEDLRWLLLTAPPSGVAPRLRRLSADAPRFLRGERILAAIDLASHAWRLDCPTRVSYLQQWLAALGPEGRRLWQEASPRSEPPAPDGSSPATLVAGRCPIYGAEEVALLEGDYLWRPLSDSEKEKSQQL